MNYCPISLIKLSDKFLRFPNLYKFLVTIKNMDDSFRKIATIFIMASLVLLAFLMLKPIMISVVMALVLAFIFSPVYEWIYKRTGNKDLSATLVILILFLIIVLPIGFLAPMLLGQVTNIFRFAYDVDFITPIKSIFPGLFVSDSVSSQIGYAFYSLTTKTIEFMSTSLTKFILNLPVILLKLTVVLFTLFFILKEKDALRKYVGSILPFSSDVEKRLFEYTSRITYSILYGQFVIGILQGIIVGLGLFIFGIPNALFLTLLAVFAGVFPVLGPFFVWIPVVIYLFSSGDNFSAWGMIIFGLIASNIDNFLRPYIVSKRVDLNPAIIMISMIGGLLFFGILGLLMGPLIISYLLIILELYRGKQK